MTGACCSASPRRAARATSPATGRRRARTCRARDAWRRPTRDDAGAPRPPARLYGASDNGRPAPRPDEVARTADPPNSSPSHSRAAGGDARADAGEAESEASGPTQEARAGAGRANPALRRRAPLRRRRRRRELTPTRRRPLRLNPPPRPAPSGGRTCSRASDGGHQGRGARSRACRRPRACRRRRRQKPRCAQ